MRAKAKAQENLPDMGGISEMAFAAATLGRGGAGTSDNLGLRSADPRGRGFLKGHAST